MQKFNYHQHTYRCGHAELDMKDEEYIEEYIKMGFEKVAFTDHCPQKNEVDKRTDMRMKYETRNEYLSSINKLKQKYADKIEIETGYEVEYLPGEEENIKELKNESNKIILGQHFIYDDNKQLKIFNKADFTDEELIRYAEYVEKAMELNIPNIIAHPDIYMMKRKEFGNIENVVANMVCKAAEKYNIPLEINLNNIFSKTYHEGKKLNNLPIEEQKEKLNNVAYPCKEFWNIATKYNVKVLYGLDVHYRGQIMLWNELVELANEIIGKETIEKLNFIEDLKD
ncbi:MAG: PHP domain-containing protein [Clostridia bacterium]|nr:PHP domain-containing protein [Clostridia bacterium]